MRAMRNKEEREGGWVRVREKLCIVGRDVEN